MQEYLTEEWENIINCERKLIFQLRTKMHFKVKSHFRNMHIDTVCDCCWIFQSTAKHTLECKSRIGQNKLVTYIPTYEDIYENDLEEQIYIARIFRDNIRRLPDIGHIFIHWWRYIYWQPTGGPCDPAFSSGLLCKRICIVLD